MDKLVIVGAWLKLVIAMVGAGVAVVVGRHAGHSQKGFGRMSAVARAFPECEVKTLITPNHTAVQVCSSG